STEDEFVSFYTGIYDKNGKPYIIPKDTLILSYKENEDTQGLSFLEVNEEDIHCLDALKEKYDAIDMENEYDYYSYVLTRYYADDKHFIPVEGYVRGEDGERIESFSFERTIPDGYTEYDSEDYKVCRIRFCENNTDAFQADFVANKVKRGEIHQSDMVLTTNSLIIDGEKYTIAEAIWIDQSRIIKRVVVTTIIVTVVTSLIAGFLLASKKYAELSAHYVIEDYRKDMTNKLAHDLKSPLMVISGYAENLENNVHTDKREHYASAILENVKYMDSIIGNVLELSRLDECELKIEKTDFDAADIVKEISESYAVQLENNGVEMTIEGSAEFHTDKGLIRCILDNLISNAVKYTDKNGKILVKCEKGKVKIINDCADADKLDIKALKKPFVKGDNSRSGRKGSGLGLSIAASAAERLGLKLSVSTENGKFIADIHE
ncbi:MAG: sensor histidine kinase, partial [Huintestinicola sp.]